MNHKVLIILVLAFVCLTKAIPVQKEALSVENKNKNVENDPVTNTDDLQTDEHRYWGHHHHFYPGFYGGYGGYPYYGGGFGGYPYYGGFGGYPYYGGFGGYPYFF